MQQVQTQAKKNLADLQADERAIHRELGQYNGRLQKLTTDTANHDRFTEMATIQDEIRRIEQRLTAVRGQITSLTGQRIDEHEVIAALSSFDPIWNALSPREQAQMIRLLVERVDYDGPNGTVAITFRPNGIKAFAQEHKEKAA